MKFVPSLTAVSAVVVTSYISTLLPINAQAADAASKPIGKPISVEIGQQYSLDSTVLAEKRQLMVHLPDGYQDSDSQYPVIYVLDGAGHFNHAVNAVSILQQRDMMPASIIVAIPNAQGMRNRDLGKGSASFWRFIKQEVTNFVETNYRTSGHKTLFGHSMAGAFVLNGFIDDNAWFDSYIAASPAMGLEQVDKFKLYFAKPPASEKQRRSLFFSQSSVAEEGKETLADSEQLVTLLEQKAPQNLNWHYRQLPQQIHMTTPYPTFYEGITLGFADYQRPSYSSYQDYLDKGGMNGLNAYYQRRATKYAVPAEEPENSISQLGYMMVADGRRWS